MPCICCNKAIGKNDATTNVRYVGFNETDQTLTRATTKVHAKCATVAACGYCGNHFHFIRGNTEVTIGENTYPVCPNCITMSRLRCQSCGQQCVRFVLDGRVAHKKVKAIPSNESPILIGKFVLFNIITNTYETKYTDIGGLRNVTCGTCDSLPKCKKCGRLIGISTTEDKIERGICIRCVDMIHPVQEYNYKPGRFVKHVHKGTSYPLIGMEVEVHIGREDGYNRDYYANYFARKLRAAKPDFDYGSIQERVYNKHDGSIRPGWEYVTMPMHKEKFMDENYNPLFNLVRTVATEIDPSLVTTHPHCGIHVHIDRRSFKTMEHIANIIWFCFKNHVPLSKWMRRDPNDMYCLAEFSPKGITYRQLLDHISTYNSLNGIVREERADGRARNARYSFVNIETGNTIELRGFRSSLNPRVIKEAAELSFALWEYTCIPIPRYEFGLAIRHGDDLTMEGFIEFIKNKPVVFPNLNARINRCDDKCAGLPSSFFM